MCGITGFCDLDRSLGEDELRARVDAMRETLHHRGPDAGGSWVDPRAGIALGHRRLSIVDLTAEGSQPMTSASGRLVISYNGELYNHAEMRAELAASGARFRGRSDTETLVEAIDAWGLERTLDRSNGMFAFALWERPSGTLHLVRDRIGIKPLYWGVAGRSVLFGSELDALRAHPDFVGRIDRDALALLLRHNHVPAPYAIYEGVRKLPPGSILSFRPADGAPDTSAPRAWWSAADALARAEADPFLGRPREAADALEALLADAVRIRTMADVPLGAFLSGGIDSSLVVALMGAETNPPPKTFTIGFPDRAFDEAPHARAVARHLGTDHTELEVTPEQALAVVPRIASVWDEPFADSSQIPTLLVSELARRRVTVALAGDGGDELFGGYRRYVWSRVIWSVIRGWPAPLRRLVRGLLRATVPDRGRSLRNVRRVAELLTAASPLALYHRLMSHWPDPGAIVLGATEPPTAYTGRLAPPARARHEQLLSWLDTVAYLPDDLLVKTDRATMAVGLEGRVPLLDHRVVEMAWRLPIGMRLRGATGKWILRRVLHRHVPASLVERPKMGFGVPLGSWLRGSLRDWACELLAPDRLRREGFLAPEPIGRLLEAHLSGRRDAHHDLWCVLVFQAWLQRQSSRDALSSSPATS